jgi:HlyD family secretion protein
MTSFRARDLSLKFLTMVAAGLLILSSPLLAAEDDPAAPKGAAVTVLKAAKSCFANIVEVSGTIIAREEAQVRPERMGLKVAEVMVDAGDSVTAGQVLAKLNLT